MAALRTDTLPVPAPIACARRGERCATIGCGERGNYHMTYRYVGETATRSDQLCLPCVRRCRLRPVLNIMRVYRFGF